MKDQLKLSALMAPHWRWWLLSLSLGALTFASIMGLLTVSGWFITASALAGLQLATAASFNYFGPAALIRFFAISRTAGRYFERLSSHQAILLLLQQLRLWFMRRFLASNFTPQSKSADLLQRLITDIDRLDQWPLRVVAPLFWAVLISSGWLATVWYWQAGLAEIALVYLLVLVTIPLLGFVLGYRRACELVELAAQRRHELLEPLSALTMLQLHQGWAAAEQQWQTTEQRYQQLIWRQQLVDLLGQFLLLSCLATMSFHLVLHALPLFQQQTISIAALVALLLSTLALPELWLPMATLYRHVADSKMAQRRLDQYQGQTEQKQAVAASTPLQLELLQLSASHIAASYSTAAINLQLKAGDLLWIQGPSGIGKSTLLATIAGWLEPASGQIVLNGYPLQHYPMQQLRQLISVLPQQITLFNMSLAANLRLAAPGATDQQLCTALAAAQLDDWLATLPQGLATELGEYGAAVSGGQARRIALARTLLQNAELILLDEPLTGLHTETADKMIKQLRLHLADKILIIVSHQPLPADQYTHHFTLD